MLKIDAEGIVAQARKSVPAPVPGMKDQVAALRARIGLVEAVLNAGAASEQSDARFRDGCRRLVKPFGEIKAAWSSAFQTEWETGKRLENWEAGRHPFRAWMQRCYANEGQLDQARGWRDAARVADRVLAVVARIEHDRDPRVKFQRDQEAREEEQRKREAEEAARMQRELEDFRSGAYLKNRRPFRQRVREERWG